MGKGSWMDGGTNLIQVPYKSIRILATGHLWSRDNERELEWSVELGMNLHRVYLHNLLDRDL